MLQAILNLDNVVVRKQLMFSDKIETDIYCLTIILDFLRGGSDGEVLDCQIGLIEIILCRDDILYGRTVSRLLKGKRTYQDFSLGMVAATPFNSAKALLAFASCLRAGFVSKSYCIGSVGMV